MEYWQWLRSKIGSKKVFLVTSAIVLLDDNDRVLMMQRGDFGTWAIPGGMLEVDESIEMCAHRELLEETGLTAHDLTLTGIYTDPKFDVVYPNGDEMQQFTFCFIGRMADGVLQADGSESLAVRWVAQQDIPYGELASWYVAMIKDALQHEGVAFCQPFTADDTKEMWREVRPSVGNEMCILPGSAAVIVRDDGRMLLQERADNGEWWFPCGFSDLGENAAQTAVREAYEEMGVEIAVERIIGAFSAENYTTIFPNGDVVKNVGVMFRCRLLSDKLALNPQEASDYKWLTPDEVRAYTAPYKIGAYTARVLEHLDEGCYLD